MILQVLLANVANDHLHSFIQPFEECLSSSYYVAVLIYALTRFLLLGNLTV